jgi:hypothetical protein
MLGEQDIEAVAEKLPAYGDLENSVELTAEGMSITITETELVKLVEFLGAKPKGNFP